MSSPILRIFIAVLCSLSLASCAIGDGVAHVVKLTSQTIQKEQAGDSRSPAPSPPPPAIQNTDDNQPPPPLAPAPPASSPVTVE